MKKLSLILVLLSGLLILSVNAQEEISPYFKVTEFSGSLSDASTQVKEVITANGFQVIGEYHPAQKDGLFVICFTNDALKKLSLQFKDRGALGSVLKTALVKENGKYTLTILNPEYMFLAYWGKQLNGQDAELVAMSDKVKAAFGKLGKLTPYGGFEEKEDLPGYHYMMAMPYFDDPEDLATFDSFEDGLKIIRKNLAAGKSNTVKVYEQLFEGEKVAVFGVGLWNTEEGEAAFLPKIGEGHIANLPYEIILQGNEATMLHGKYRIALFWPELTMGTFMKISGAPGDIEEMLEEVTEE
ncbi:MAG: hypothetical protein L3J66_10785 [Bacteroidales bacterium]|nr:hypothetical protein [Bacteroidales bacterium]